jgi:hypothetical protein
MGNLAITYQHIADILSFTVSKLKLEETLKNPDFDWDAIVVEGSKHLVLPAIFCRLKSKALLHVLPTELKIYLEEITSINRNRNRSILKQVHSLSKILNETKIDHVFLKGSALLALGCYEDNAERMVGDIDILVASEHLNTAFKIIKNNGYENTFGYAYKTIGHRHLDRLISKTELAAIEVHSNLLNDNYSHYIDSNKMIKSKRYVNNISIPSIYYLSKHHIYAWQINDDGYYYKSIHFKYCYDSIILKVSSNEELLQGLIKNKYGTTYLYILKLYFEEFKTIPLSNKRKSYQNLHLNYLDKKLYKKILMPIKKGYYYISTRFILIMNNKYYRRHLLKKIFVSKI